MVGNNSKVKKSSSVHEGEDITLCWIETTTIKEDKTIQPPKRLVIREYTISFENSATIPEKYLECKRYEGELTANDPDVGKTALFEIIDEDTMVSRIVNFTSVNHVGNITTWEHKKVKCGVGPVVSKIVIELTDGSKNPKKRVEIKVSPKMHRLTATTTDKEEPCTESSESSTFTEFTEHTTGLSCENGVCETTRIPSSISPKTGYELSTAEETVTKLSSKTESETEEYHSLSTVTKSSPVEKVSRRSTISPKISTPTQEYQEKINCEENPSDPACLTQKHISSSEKFPESTEVSTTEAVTVIETSSIPISDKEKTTREAISLSSIEGKLSTQTSVTPREEKKVTSDLEIEETTPFAIITDISMESSEAHSSQSTDQASVEGSITSLETKIISATEEVGEYSKSEESSTDLTSKEIEKVDRVTDTNKVTSVEVDTKPDVTTTIPIEFTKFTKGPDKPDQRDKLTEPPSSTETTTRTVIIEFSSTSEKVSSKESKEGVTSAVDGSTRVGLKTSSEEEKLISISTRTSPTIVESTTLSPVISSKIGYSCENSEECTYTSLGTCDKFGNCGETTTKCDSEICSEERVTEDRSKFDTSSPSTMKIPPSAISQTSSEESAMIETQYTTIEGVATTMLTSRESEDNATTVNNVPTTMDTRRSTTTSMPRHKMTLMVKILLQHTNENNEKQNLVEVEKHLSLDENLEHHNHPALLKQLKSLNDSINMETISALLNCTSLGNWTRDSNFVKKELDDVVDDSDEELESTNSDLEDSMSVASGYSDVKNDYSDYEEVRSRRRRSLDKMEELDKFVRRNLYDSIDSVINFFNQSEVDSVNLRNISTSQKTELMTDTLTLPTTTNYIEEETTEGPNVTNEADESTIPSTTMIFNITDLLNATKSYKNFKGNVQLTPTTNKSETTSAEYIENGKNIVDKKNESTMPLIKEDISNKTKMEVMRETLPGIQEDVVVGLQHMVSQLMESNLTSITNIKEAFKTNLLDILADPKDTRVGSRRRRAATEEVGHWSNERIKEAPMGGNLRSLTEFTLYKVLL